MPRRLSFKIFLLYFAFRFSFTLFISKMLSNWSMHLEDDIFKVDQPKDFFFLLSLLVVWVSTSTYSFLEDL